MNYNTHRLALSTLLILVASTAAAAAVPTTIGLEGKLVTAAGGPVADGDYNVTFALYPSATAQQPAWSETVAESTAASPHRQRRCLTTSPAHFTASSCQTSTSA